MVIKRIFRTKTLSFLTFRKEKTGLVFGFFYIKISEPEYLSTSEAEKRVNNLVICAK